VTTAVFLQVRIGSRRLPAKALLPLEGIPVIRHVLRSLVRIGAEHHVVLTDPASVGAFRSPAQLEGFHLMVGPEEDVLARYAMAAKRFRPDTIIRATGDNPLVSVRLAGQILRVHSERAADLSHFVGNPLGTGVEVIGAGALLTADAEAVDPYEREHITTFLYRRAERFSIVEEPCPKECRLPGVKVSLDSWEDYRFLEKIYRDLGRAGPIETDVLVRWLKDNGYRGGRLKRSGEDTPVARHEAGGGDGSSEQMPRSRGQAG
jgi:spore coat polysaccharide biosynthesis protein SpsF